MLVLSRKPQQSVIINGNIKVTVVRIDGYQVRLGIEAPRDVPIQREELLLNLEVPQPESTITVNH